MESRHSVSSHRKRQLTNRTVRSERVLDLLLARSDNSTALYSGTSGHSSLSSQHSQRLEERPPIPLIPPTGKPGHPCRAPTHSATGFEVPGYRQKSVAGLLVY